MEAWNEAHPDDQITLLDPQYGRTTTDTGRATAEAILDANPDIDALIVAGGGGDTLLGAIAGIEARGLTGKIAVVSTDFLPDLDVKLQTGAMAAESGGHYADPFFAFLMVYNAIKGNYPTSTEGFYDMVFPYMFVASPEDYANYAEYFTGAELPYYEDEIANLAGLSYDDLAAFVNVIKVGSITATAGNQLETQILISLVLGGLPITGGAKVRFSNIIVGTLMYTVLNNGLVMMGFDSATQQLIKGIIFLLFVALTIDRKALKVIK